MEEKRQPQPDKKESKLVLSPEIEKYVQILRKDPRSPVFAALSDAYRKGGLLDEAIAVANEGLKHNPNYTTGRIALGRAYYDKEDLDRAMDELGRVVKAMPDNIIAHRLIADIFIKKSDSDSAIKELKTVLYLSPNDKETKALLATLTGSPAGQPAQKQAPLQQPAEPQKPAPEILTPETESPLPPAAELQPPAQNPEEQVSEQLPQAGKTEREGFQQGEKPETADKDNIPSEQYEQPRQPVPEPEQPAEQQSVAEPEKQEAPPPVSDSESDAASVESELETALNKPVLEPEAEQPFPQPAPALEPAKEDAPSGMFHEPPARPEEPEIRQSDSGAEMKEEVKTEELEAVFDELSESAMSPPEVVSAPAVEPVKQEPETSEQGSMDIGQKKPEIIETKALDLEITKSERTDEPEKAGIKLEEPQERKPTSPQTSELQSEDIQTVTMADLYVKQGHFDKAYQIYKKILLKNPDSPIIRARFINVKKLMESKQPDLTEAEVHKKIEVLKEQEPKPQKTEQPDTVKENMKRLNSWLDKIKKGG